MPAHRLWMKSGASGRAIEFEHPVLKVVMLGQIALFEYTQL